MKLLQICNKPPVPAVDGGTIAMNNTTLGLINQGVKVKVVSIATQKHPVNIDSLSKEYKDKTGFEYVFIDTSIKLKDAFLNLFSSKSYNVERFISNKFSDKIKEILKSESFDVILIESLFVTPYIPVLKQYSNAKIVLRAHNVEHKIWEQYGNNTKNFIKKQYLKLLSSRLKKYEIKVIKELDGICAMTEIDKKQFEKLGCQNPISSLPAGYQLNGEIKNDYFNTAEKQSLFHIASMDWEPNKEGLDWFLSDVWNQVVNENPNTILYLAGRNMPKKYYELNEKGIVVVGEVKEAKEFYKSKQIMLVPLKSGSGMRIKIIEGMALGKVIISTSIGAEGIKCTHNKNIIIADNEKEFALAIKKCLNDEEFCKEIGRNAKELIKQEYNNQLISEKMVAFFENLN